MAATPGTRWIVGTATEVGALEERLGDADATIRETWPQVPAADAAGRHQPTSTNTCTV